jgi:hypothetical protein
MAAPANMGWNVESQRSTTELDPASGKAVKGMAIGYVTPLGNHGEVFIPGDVYARGPEAVKPLIAAAVMNMDAIHKLSG